jgi:hypothetical protein
MTKPRTPPGRPGSKGRRAAGQSLTAPQEAVVQGAQPAPGRPGSGRRRTRRFGRPGVLQPVAVMPARLPGMQAAAGNFAASRAGHRAGPGWLQCRTPVLGGIRIGALRLQAGWHRAPRLAGATLHGGTRPGNLRAPGAVLPQSGPNRQQPAPACWRGRCSCSGQRKSSHHRAARPPLDAHLAGDPAHHAQAMTGPVRPPAVPAAAGDILPIPGQRTKAPMSVKARWKSVSQASATPARRPGSSKLGRSWRARAGAVRGRCPGCARSAREGQCEEHDGEQRHAKLASLFLRCRLSI